MQTLTDAHVLSAPVLEHGRFIGFLDMKDLTHYVVYAIDSSRPAGGRSKSRSRSPSRTHTVPQPNPALHSPATPSPASRFSQMQFLEMAMQGITLQHKDPMAGVTNKCMRTAHPVCFSLSILNHHIQHNCQYMGFRFG